MLNVAGTLNFDGKSIFNAIIDSNCNTLTNLRMFVPVIQGGTGYSSLPVRGILIGNSTNIPTIQTISGNIVDTQSSQSLANKIITSDTVRGTLLATSGANVDISNSIVPTTGYVLTATGSTSATWAASGGGQSVLFSAYKSADSTGVATGSSIKIIYDTVITNLNNAYDNSTGVVTSPLSGYYLFINTNTLDLTGITVTNVTLGATYNGSSNVSNYVFANPAVSATQLTTYGVTTSQIIQLNLNDTYNAFSNVSGSGSYTISGGNINNSFSGLFLSV